MDDTQNTTQEKPAEESTPAAAAPPVSYIGEEELKYFLSLINRLGDLKYMPIDKIIDKAQTAVEANRLSKTVSINGQLFDGTQNITFDEYAKSEDVLTKSDCAVAGAKDNSNKVVVLNSEGKVNGDYIDFEHIIKRINEAPFEEVMSSLQALQEAYKADIATVTASDKNQNTDIATIKSYVGMRQAEVNVSKAPAKVTIDDVEYESYCAPALDVLKSSDANKTANLDYVKMGYHSKQGVNCTVASNSISIKPTLLPKALLIREKYPEVNIHNYKDYPHAWSQLQSFTVNGTEVFTVGTCPIDTSKLSPLAQLSLLKPAGTFYYSVLVNDRTLYRIDKTALVKCIDSPTPVLGENVTAESLIPFIAEAKKGTPNTLVTIDMIRSLNNVNVRIILCTDTSTELTCTDMVLKDIPQNGHIIEAETMLNAQVKEIKSITPNVAYTEGDLRFGIKKADTTEYAVWNTTTGKWETIGSVDEIITKGATVEDLSKIPAASLNIDNLNYSFVFAFMPTAMDATCTLNAIAMSYIDAVCYEKAVHGKDYGYALGRRSITVTFNTTGDYLINYPITDVIPFYNRKVTKLTPQ